MKLLKLLKIAIADKIDTLKNDASSIATICYKSANPQLSFNRSDFAKGLADYYDNKISSNLARAIAEDLKKSFKPFIISLILKHIKNEKVEKTWPMWLL